MDYCLSVVLQRIKDICVDILSTNCIGIYVHGSLAFGCFHWEKSDIDLIIVCRFSPTLQEKVCLMKNLLDIDKICPPKGLEMSVVLEKYCQNFVYPTPFELHFSHDHIQKCKDDLKEYCRHMNGTDRDLAAHFTVIKQKGITLYGQKADILFEDVPQSYYLDSIQYDIENAVDQITKDPIYVLLNLCRVLAYIKEGRILSKQQGALWGIEHLTDDSHLICIAEECYRCNKPFPSNIDNQELVNFAVNMLAKIF